jgi:hypothetical protein
MKDTLRFEKWLDFAIGVISFLSLVFLIWSAYSVAIQPYDGLDWKSLTGEVYAAAP